MQQTLAEERAKTKWRHGDLILTDYLHESHEQLQKSIKINTVVTETTQGGFTDPTGKLCPKRIEKWDKLGNAQPEFCSKASYDSRDFLHRLGGMIRGRLISSEDDVAFVARLALETPVTCLRRRQMESVLSSSGENEALAALRHELEEERKKNDAALRHELEEERKKNEELNEKLKDQGKRLENTTLRELLEACHATYKEKFRVLTNVSWLTKGTPKNVKGKKCPDILLPWTTFEVERDDTYNNLCESLGSVGDGGRLFPNHEALDLLLSVVSDKSIETEENLKTFRIQAIETFLKLIFEKLAEDEGLRSKLELMNELIFDEHGSTRSMDD